MTEQQAFAIATLIKPIAVFAVFGALIVIRFAVIRYCPSGIIKRLLLLRITNRRN
jgi:hypothetical protein